MKENDQTKYGDNKQNLTQAVENFNEFYIKMTTQLQKDQKDVAYYGLQFATFR